MPSKQDGWNILIQKSIFFEPVYRQECHLCNLIHKAQTKEVMTVSVFGYLILPKW